MALDATPFPPRSFPTRYGGPARWALPHTGFGTCQCNGLGVRKKNWPVQPNFSPISNWELPVAILELLMPLSVNDPSQQWATFRSGMNLSMIDDRSGGRGRLLFNHCSAA